MTIKPSLLFSMLFLTFGANAGQMGPAHTESLTIPFVSIEGSYTWPTFKTQLINGVSVDNSIQGWGGRAAGGLVHTFSNNWGVSGEIGWGDYARVSQNLVPASAVSMTIYGFDILAGALYQYNRFDFFAKAGAMLEDVRTTSSQNTALTNLTETVLGDKIVSSSSTNVIPELKVGGEYNFTDQLALSLAYMYAFGYPVSTVINQSLSGSVLTNHSTVYDIPASLSTIQLGLRYKFV